MNEEEEVQITENPLNQRDSIEDENTDLTATLLKRYVTIVGDGKDGSACKWICNFGCKVDPYTGTYSRIRAHLIGLLPGQKSQGVAICSKISKDERKKLKKEEEEAKKRFGGGTRKRPIPTIPIVPPVSKLAKVEKGKKNIYS
ncbi:hypothetical protein MRB53_009864 [Persea americana]|uniref:Uncharacterized protein n=1 Tax=Persea americana TaxID=3435 RepID=A0ACC2LR94_PERAE|nr:hypothetical protein MRB53_009864 [Persea americana]